MLARLALEDAYGQIPERFCHLGLLVSPDQLFQLFLSNWAALARGYPVAIAGDIRHFQWTKAIARLELAYWPDLNVSSPSLIYVRR